MSSSVVGSEASPLTPLIPLREGDLLASRYRIESLVRARSTGVHCARYAATDLTSGTRVSAHVLVASRALESGNVLSLDGKQHEGRDAARVAFLAGARRAKTLESAFVARVLDAGVTTEGHPWIVREHLASDTLAAHLHEHGALGTRDAVDVALAVCDAIAEAHAHDILHLSLGPHAVHVAWSASGLVDIKVTGAGTAAAEAALAFGSTGDVEAVLRAPEQLRLGTNVDSRADVWSIAVLLHTMLAGAPPFATDTPSGASLSVILDDPPSLAGVPDELADVVERALARDPEQRPQTVLELAESLVVFSSHPDIERDRIAKRRAPIAPAPPLAPPLPMESDPTLVVDKRAYDALAQERVAAKSQPPAAPSSIDVLGEIAPSMRELPIEPPSRPTVPTLAPIVQATTTRDEPTRIIPKPERTFPHRKMFKRLGVVAAAACGALLVGIGTEGARLSRNAATAGENTSAVAAAVALPVEPSSPRPPIAATDLPSVPTETATASSPPALPEAPAPSNPKRLRAAAAPTAPPASKPSPSGPTDDLRRFLDDRR